MVVKTVLKYVLLVFVTLMTSMDVFQLLSLGNVAKSMDGESAGFFLLLSMASLTFHGIGLYGIANEHFISSLIFSVVSVLGLIGMISMSLFVVQEVFMVYISLVVAIFTAMMVSYTIMIREKTPVEGNIAYTKNII